MYECHETMEFVDTDWIESTGNGQRRLHSAAKPKPMHKWWTQTQKLYPSDPHEYRFFGDEVSIWGDVIAIMGGGESLTATYWTATSELTYQFGSLYMFSRSRTDQDVWTQQQKLYNPDENDSTFFSYSVD